MKSVNLVLSRNLLFVPGLAAMALTAGCGTEPRVPASITISPDTATILWFDETAQLTATGQDPDGRTIPGVTVTWTSGDESVVTVDATGLVTPVAKGVTSVRAEVGGVEGTATVEVAPDRRALRIFYEALGGPGWINSQNWGTDAPLDEWYGVTADSRGNVQALAISLNNLSGTIPSEIGALGALQFLALIHAEGLTGSIPPELGNLRNLRDLYLVGNNLIGPIPPALGNLTELRVLLLSSNQLRGLIPAELGSLENLGSLDLSGNNLAGPIPAELGSLENLGSLDLSRNNLAGPIPAELGNIPQLSSLFLGDNQLEGPIPAALGNLESLGSLRVSGNALTGSIPAELGNLTQLGSLFLGDNQLEGPIPPELGNLGQLSRLFLSSNALTGSIPPEFVNLENLAYLAIDRTLLSGRLPRELIGVPLRQFHWNETDLCSPADQEYRRWLALISDHIGNRECSS